MVVSRSFGREKRLLTSRQFSAVFDSPDGKVSNRYFLALVRNSGLLHPRLGLVIGKKNVKLAVERNRLKRVMRDSFRCHQELIGALDITLVARKGLGDVDNAELHQQLEKLWKRLARQTAPKPPNTTPDVPATPQPTA